MNLETAASPPTASFPSLRPRGLQRAGDIGNRESRLVFSLTKLSFIKVSLSGFLYGGFRPCRGGLSTDSGPAHLSRQLGLFKKFASKPAGSEKAVAYTLYVKAIERERRKERQVCEPEGRERSWRAF
ncbi:MAG: hypothetical protein O7F12_11850 [Nitrospirae bacterium]|nr:hypothetical protein [Nitrospirota bacterium]